MSDRDLILESLKAFVLRAAEKEATAEEIAVLPAVAKILLDYLPSDESRDSSVL